MSNLSPFDLLLFSEHEQTVFRTLTKQPKQTVTEITHNTGLSIEEVETVIAKLLAQGSLVEQLQAGARRLSVRLQVKPKSVRNMPSNILDLLAKAPRSFLSELPLTQQLADTELDALLQLSNKRTLLPDEVAIWQGEKFGFVAVVESGLIMRTRLKGQHLSEKMGYTRRTEWLGLSATLSNAVATETFTAVTETTLLSWSQQDFLNFLQQTNSLSVALCQQLSQQMETCKSLSGHNNGKLWVIEGIQTAVGVSTLAKQLANAAHHNAPNGINPPTLLWHQGSDTPQHPPLQQIGNLATIYPHPQGYHQLVREPQHEYPIQVQLDILLTELLATYEYIICDTGTHEQDELLLRLRGQGHVLLTLTNDPQTIPLAAARWQTAQPYAIPNQKRLLALSQTKQQIKDIDPKFHLVIPYDPTLDAEYHPNGTSTPPSVFENAVQEIYRRLSLNHALAIFVPSTLDVDQPVDNDQQVQTTLQFLGSVFGGATKSDAEGVWRSEDSGLVTEQVTIVRTFVSKPALDTHLDRVIEFATHLKEEMKQEAVALSVDHQLILV